MNIITIDKFNYRKFRLTGKQKRAAGNPATSDRRMYKDIISAYDIETTRIEEVEQSVMYIWQWCFDDENCVVVGRTWEEFIDFVDRLCLCMKPSEKLCVFVHNLSFEFFFLRGVLRFEQDKVFAIDSRKILKAEYKNIEFRCSYLHSNMSLAEYTKKMGVKHQKLPDYEYEKKRYSFTSLTDDELSYCVNDVVGLVEAIRAEMTADGDNLYTFPLTSTGYVRRDAKRAMRDVPKETVRAQYADYEIYQMLREAFRGGDTHANRFFAGQIVNSGHAADRSSSYPDTAVNCQFPMGEFHREKNPLSFDEVMKLITVRNRACVMRVAINGLELRQWDWPLPYLSVDKCRNLMPMQFDDCIIPITKDNGRLLEAGYLETTITDVDLRIIAKEYKWRDIVFYDVAHTQYRPLPEPLLAEFCEYYRRKTELKGVKDQAVYYMKSKNKLNSIYGMMAQNPAKLSQIYFPDGVIDEKTGNMELFQPENKTEKDVYEDHARKAFLLYQWGVWVTAWSRYRLHEGVYTVLEQGGEFLYCDTDSIKYLGDIDWSAYNNQRIADSTAHGAFAKDAQDVTHYMGVFEPEEDFRVFRTWGAKKYAYTTVENGKEVLHTTIAGVGKKAGAAELIKAGKTIKGLPDDMSDAEKGLHAFEPGFVFVEAGGLEAIYNDFPGVKSWEVDGNILEITPNVTLRPSTYTLGLAGDYERLLKNRRYKELDISQNP